ncbi:MAG: hypothetical protein JWP75_695 [Frondihabitans sp.]|nr:hypothetical protein [Frondihabitans sp.]
MRTQQHGRVRGSRAAIGLLVGALAAVGILGLPAAATAATAPTGTVTVALVTPQKKAIVNDFYVLSATVSLIAPDGTTITDHTSPDSSGHFVFDKVPAGITYTVHVEQEAQNVPYFSTRRSGLMVVAGTDTWIDVVDQKGGAISGTISGPPAGYTAGVDVAALDATTGKVVESDVDDSDGSYLLQGLPTGDYKLEFDLRTSGEHNPGNLNYVWQFYPGVSTFASAATVHVAAETATAPLAAATGIDAVLQTGHALSGRVFSSFPQDFEQNCQVHYVSSAIGDSFCTSMDDPAGSGFTEVVVPGDYKIEVTRPSTTHPGTTITYWYAGPGVAPTSSESGAATIHFSGTADQAISMTVH